MVQRIKQPSLSARLGTGIGQGFSEAFPKELERGRLAYGLKQFEQDYQDLSPMQQLARISSIPGITPQMIQSFSEQARLQNSANAYGRSSGRPISSPPQEASANIPEQQGAPATRGQSFSVPQRMDSGVNLGTVPQQTPSVGRNEQGQPQILPQNPLAQQFVSGIPWTPAQRNARVSGYIGQGFLPDKAEQLAADDEKRFLATPEAYKKQYKDFEDLQNTAKNKLRSDLELKLQKKFGDSSIFKDLSGDMIKNLERGVERDLRQFPDKSLDDVVNDWSNRGFRLAKTNTDLDTLSKTTGIENLTPGRGSETLNKLKAYQKIYQVADNLEEFQKDLISKFNLSPQGAASLAYPRSSHVERYIKNTTQIPPNKAYELSRKAAIDIEQRLKPTDSLLAIARDLSIHHPNFDQEAFFRQLTEDMESQGFNGRQQEEIAKGQRGVIPNWADILIFPFFEKLRR